VRLDLLKLHAHAHATIAPRDSRFRIDVLLRSGKAEAEPYPRVLFERTRCPDSDAAVAQVQRECGGNGVAEAVGNRNSQNDTWAGAAVVVVGEQMRSERRQNMVNTAVIVAVAGF